MIKKAFGLFTLLNLIFLGSCGQAQTETKHEITVSRVQEKIAANEHIILLDVRTQEEYTGQLGHVNSSLLIPLDELDARSEELEQFKEQEIIVICRSGNRSGYATRILRDKNFKAFNMLGGMIAWNKSIELQKKED